MRGYSLAGIGLIALLIDAVLLLDGVGQLSLLAMVLILVWAVFTRCPL